MDEKSKTYSQIFDSPIHNGIIAQIGEKVFSFLVVLASFANANGSCYPPEDRLKRIMGISERAVRNRIAAAKLATYRGLPALAVKPHKTKKGGKLVFANNMYTISPLIWEDVITRYYSTGNKLPLEQSKERSSKFVNPPATFPPAEKLPHNDIPSLNKIINNDMDNSYLKKIGFRGVALDEFYKTIKDRDDYLCWEIATWLGEKYINFILANRRNQRCGMEGIQWAYLQTKEQAEGEGVGNRQKYFNGLITIYKRDKNKI